MKLRENKNPYILSHQMRKLFNHALSEQNIELTAQDPDWEPIPALQLSEVRNLMLRYMKLINQEIYKNKIKQKKSGALRSKAKAAELCAKRLDRSIAIRNAFLHWALNMTILSREDDRADALAGSITTR